MTLSDLSIRKPVFAWMLMIGLMVFGGICLPRLGVSTLPDVTQPVLSVNVVWPGAAPELMESEIADKLEDACISVQGIVNITTTLRQSMCSLKLEFAVDRNIDAALQETNSRIRAVDLPEGADPPTIMKFNEEDSPFMWLAVTSDLPFAQLVTFVDQRIRDRFLIVPGVGNVVMGGWADRTMKVRVDADKLTKYELTILDIRATLQKENSESAAGYLEGRDHELNVRVMGEAMTPDQMRNILITTRGGAVIHNSRIRLGDVATIEDGVADVRAINRTNGVRGIGLGVQKQRGYNEVQVARDVIATMHQLNKEIPKDIRISINFDRSQFTEESIRETWFTLIMSAVVTGVVCWAFLGSWRSTFNVLISIPTSVLGSFIVLYMMNFTLNFFTLLALSLAIGIVVDDAIMVLENIVRHFHMGKTARQAALDGTREITFAATAATIAIVAIFLPVAFAPGLIGKFLFQFGVTISTAVLLSLLESITLTPMRCSQIMTAKDDESRFAKFVNRIFDFFSGLYGRSLAVALNNRLITIGLSFVAVAAMLSLLPKMRAEISPGQDAGVLIVQFETPVGSSLEFTGERISHAEAFLKKQPYVRQFMANVGGLEGGQSNSGMCFISLIPKHDRPQTHMQIMELLRDEFAKIKDLKSSVFDPTQKAFSNKRGSKIELALQGRDYTKLSEYSKEILKRLKALGIVSDLDSDYKEGAAELHVVPDREKAARSNVPIASIAETINTAIGGIRVGKFTKDDRRYDINLRLQADQWRNPQDLARLMVRTRYGELIPLTSVAKMELKPKMTSIHRENRTRSITLYMDVKPGVSQVTATEKAREIAKQVMQEEGYGIVDTGAASAMKEAGQGFLIIMGMGFLISYIVLAVQFNSFIHPFTVLVAVLYTIPGAILSLVITNNSFNLYSGIGFILLMGIVKKNAILLVEFFNRKRFEEKRSLKDAILEGGPIRLRPIVMTTAAATAAAVPAAFGFGPGAEVRVPLAIVVIGGTLVASVFTLYIIPCVYSLLSGLESSRTELEEATAEIHREEIQKLRREPQEMLK
ncbi:MAG: efflux RND transporter permease subunit [Candidatus Methylacidiphilales bacterium]|nr:efflux RND transporter permease subunit [Candidatus Methylacidiphilales bacterium]